ncbi:hypothetical protein ASPCAL02026 [Aspergillus calidoustus]|uniref:Uncharacterized protein n=1 Tax=Aspergillus calidoustus TaxID=454130 RepID=A0A0U4ZTX5_ASPCI|nr:hypothetical protein ASPCAL02026 [Aspergillus calidoustus]
MAAEPPSPEFLAESQGPTVKAVMWLMSGLAASFVMLRLYVRLHLKRVFGWDDLMAVVAAGCLLGYAANPKNLIAAARFSSISQTLPIMSCALGKTAFAVTLLRIVVERWMKYLLWFIIITMNTVNTLAALFVFVQCKDP